MNRPLGKPGGRVLPFGSVARVHVSGDPSIRYRLTTLLQEDGHTVTNADVEERSGDWAQQAIQVILETLSDSGVIGVLLGQYLNREKKLEKVEEIELLGPDGQVLKRIRREKD